MDGRRFSYLLKTNFLFWLSKKIDYPLVMPDALQINFTFLCNLRCKMCSQHERLESFKAQQRPYEIAMPTMKKMIKEAAQMRIPSLILIGGEPFLEPHLFELVSYAHESGIHGITVVTNGTIMSEDVVNKMFDSDLPNLSISIDASSEETYSKIRGEHVFNKVIANINFLNEMKQRFRRWAPSIVCVCTIMNQNLQELLDVVHLCRRLKINRIIFQPVVADNTDQANPDFNSPVFIPPERLAELDSQINALIQYKKSSSDNYAFIANSIDNLNLIKKYFRQQVRPHHLPCYAGYNRLQVVQEGKIYFCVSQKQYESTFGNVATDSLRSLWFSKKARWYRKIIRKCRYPCVQWCSYRDEFTELADVVRMYKQGLISRYFSRRISL